MTTIRHNPSRKRAHHKAPEGQMQNRSGRLLSFFSKSHRLFISTSPEISNKSKKICQNHATGQIEGESIDKLMKYECK